MTGSLASSWRRPGGPWDVPPLAYKARVMAGVHGAVTVDDLPLLASGKPDRGALWARAAQKD